MIPSTLGELKKQGFRSRSVKDEIRSNLIRKVRSGEELFPGILGYEESVIPAIVNALLARHNFILLGLRGQAKSRILRDLTGLLDEQIPVIEGSELNEDPFAPISEESLRRLKELGDDLPVAFLKREDRYVEKLATPDVTVADLIGDLDPIKAARSGRQLSDLSNIHFGLLPRANRGIFSVNELPDLAPKIQVALFNIMQEGDIQIKGFPVRLPLDVLLVFSANPEDYTARGKIVTPLKDRIGAEIRTHYPEQVEAGIQITRQEAWQERSPSEIPVGVPRFIREIVELVAFRARRHPRVDHHSGVSQRLPISCLETMISNAERRALTTGSKSSVLRIADLYAALPALSGKIELTYEGEMKGSEAMLQEIIGQAVKTAFDQHCSRCNFDPILQWFDLGGTLQVTDLTSDRKYLDRLEEIQGLEAILEDTEARVAENPGLAVSWSEFFLEGLCAQKRLSRSADRGYFRETDEEGSLYDQMESGNVSLS